MASRTVTGKVVLNLQSDLVNNLDNVGKVTTSQVGNTQFVSQTFSSGVSSGQFNRTWEKTFFNLLDGTNEEINLADFSGQDIGVGAGDDAVGLPMDLEEVVMIAIKNTSTPIEGGAGGPWLEIEPSLASGWTAIGSHTVVNGGAISPGGCLLKFNPGEAGFDIQPGTAERILLTANGGTVDATVLIFGRNDDDESSSSSSASTASSSSSSVSSSSVSSSFSSSLSSSSSS
jgi:hypothetical protein